MKPILDRIAEPGDLKHLSSGELNQLAREIREKIIDTVSRTGGHLGASLGAVELSLALHRVFRSPKDKIIWDVGHQSYAHKILTGRRDAFGTLRQFRGLSGFPKMHESPHDAFGTGHSSTSISAAMGYALARDRQGLDYHVVAVIGDGATTGGMAFEALNHAGKGKTGVIIVLNDNGMSISSNVGALAHYLARIRLGPSYQRAKGDIESVLRKIPLAGDSVAEVCRRLKDSLKYLVVPGVLFEEMGFTYLGPVDGHDVGAVETILRRAARSAGPCLVHVVTQKGKGYGLAEKDPDVYHGPGPFDPSCGLPKNSSPRKSFSRCFGDAMIEACEEDERVVAVAAAMVSGTGLDELASRYPDRLIDVGIAEQHAVTLGAGLAAAGLRPVVAIYSTFLQRAYDQVNHDVCLQNLPVVFAIDRAGLVGEDGETHQGVFDLSYLLHIPNLSIMAPSSAEELSMMLKAALRSGGPVAIRYPRGPVPAYRPHTPLEWGRTEVLREGSQICILSVGHCLAECIVAHEALEARGISATLLNTRFLKPLDWNTVIHHAVNTRSLLIVEEAASIGGVASYVLMHLAKHGLLKLVDVDYVGIPDYYVQQGAVGVLRHKIGLDAEGIAKAAERLWLRRSAR